jgi:hypothetical protein
VRERPGRGHRTGAESPQDVLELLTRAGLLRQVDLEHQLAALDRAPRGPQPPDERTGLVVRREHCRREPPYPLVARPVGQRVEQDAADAAALPVVDNRDRQLRLGLIRTDEARDTDHLRAHLVHGDQRLVTVVVDVRQVLEVALRQGGDVGKEAAVARFRAQPPEPREQQLAIAARDRPDGDPRPVLQRVSRPITQ